MRARFEGDLDEYFFICLQNSFLLFWSGVVRSQNHADILITFSEHTQYIYESMQMHKIHPSPPHPKKVKYQK